MADAPCPTCGAPWLRLERAANRGGGPSSVLVLTHLINCPRRARDGDHLGPVAPFLPRPT